MNEADAGPVLARPFAGLGRSTRVYAPAVQAKPVQALNRLRAESQRRYDGTSEKPD